MQTSNHTTADTATPLAAVVFDMGGVLMTFNGMRFARIFTENEEDAALLNAAVFGSGMWPLLDAGVISHETLRRTAAAHLPARLHENLDTCLAHWPEHSEVIEGTSALIPRLKELGIGVYLLSNASTRIELQISRNPAWPLFDGAVVSGFERLMKPDPAIYQLLCERYELDPASCLFVDDNADNCAGAQAAGMRAFHFTGDVAALEQALENALGTALES